jgi:hypothetical protein
MTDKRMIRTPLCKLETPASHYNIQLGLYRLQPSLWVCTCGNFFHCLKPINSSVILNSVPISRTEATVWVVTLSLVRSSLLHVQELTEYQRFAIRTFLQGWNVLLSVVSDFLDSPSTRESW